MNVLTPPKVVRSLSAVSAATAIRFAWVCWSIFLVIPFALGLWFVGHTAQKPQTLSQLPEERWFVAAMILLGLVAPVAFFWRERLYEHHQNHEIPPGKYLAGMVTIWVALLVAGIFSLVGCIVVGNVLPNLVPALMALGLFLMLWPTGRSIACHIDRAKAPTAHEVHKSEAD